MRNFMIYISVNSIIRTVKSKRLTVTRHIVRIEETRNA
jgi:hypothetical protein